jgi:hypothetical protein
LAVNTDSLSGIYTGLYTASNWSLYRSGRAHLAINKKIADTDTVSTIPKMPEIPPLNSIELNRLYFSDWCMVTESIMQWVF